MFRFATAFLIIVLLHTVAFSQVRDESAHDAVQAAERRIEVVAGLGLEGFIGKPMRDVAGAGPAWTVAAIFGNPESVRTELAYLGSRQPLRGMDNGGDLTGHGVQGIFRINVYPEARIEPYFFMGAGWSRFSTASAVTAELARKDDVFVNPIGIGAALRRGGLVLDARAGIVVVTGPDLIPKQQPNGSEDSEIMHRYGATAHLGYSF